MTKQIGNYILGTTTLILLMLGFELAISLKLIFSESIGEWIGASSNPRALLLDISLIGASSALTLIKLGIKLPQLKDWIDNANRPLISSLLGLPLLTDVATLIVASFGLIVFGPVCQSPTADIKISAVVDNSIIAYDGHSLTVKTGTILTAEAIANENSLVFCTWSSNGKVISSIEPKSSCKTQIVLTNEPGRGIVLLTLDKSSCSAKSTHPIEIITVQ